LRRRRRRAAGEQKQRSRQAIPGPALGHSGIIVQILASSKGHLPQCRRPAGAARPAFARRTSRSRGFALTPAELES
jgi:hypothetical protein